MSCPQSESVANHRSSATPIKNRQFFVKVFYLSVFYKVVFGEVKSNWRILRFLQAFHHPVLFRALVRRFFCRRADLSLSQGSFAFQMLRTMSFEHIFGLPPRFPVLRRHLRFGYAPSAPSCALCKPLRPFARFMRSKPETALIPHRSALRATIPSSFLTHGAQTHSMRTLSFRHFRTRAVLVWRIEHIRAPPPPRCCVFPLFPYVLPHTLSNLVLFHAHI